MLAYNNAITFEHAEGEVYFVRCHTDPDKIPGDVEWSCAAEIDGNGKCELKIFGGKRGPTTPEKRQLTRYFVNLGYRVTWHRYKNGKMPKTVTVK